MRTEFFYHKQADSSGVGHVAAEGDRDVSFDFVTLECKLALICRRIHLYNFIQVVIQNNFCLLRQQRLFSRISMHFKNGFYHLLKSISPRNRRYKDNVSPFCLCGARDQKWMGKGFGLQIFNKVLVGFA